MSFQPPHRIMVSIDESIGTLTNTIHNPDIDVIRLCDAMHRIAEAYLMSATVFNKPCYREQAISSIMRWMDNPNADDAEEIYIQVYHDLRDDLRHLNINPWGLYESTVTPMGLSLVYLGDYRIITWSNSDDANQHFPQIPESQRIRESSNLWLLET